MFVKARVYFTNPIWISVSEKIGGNGETLIVLLYMSKSGICISIFFNIMDFLIYMFRNNGFDWIAMINTFNRELIEN